VIGRLNVGGPAIQAITLTKLLESRGYHTTLVRGVEGPREGSMDYLAAHLGVRPIRLSTLRRELGRHDVRAVLSVRAMLRRERPQVLHTHAAKGGTVGRVAALLAGRGRPEVIVHTFHGHSLTGYFSSRASTVFALIERVLGRGTTRLVAVSEEVRADLVRLRVAPATKIDVIALGFDFARFEHGEGERSDQAAALREDLGIPSEARVVTLVARLVPVKRVDRFLRVAQQLGDVPNCRFLVVGDGELRDELRALPEAQALGERLVWAGYRRDIPQVLFASDVVVLTSDNEGTPVSLIEAQAAGVPVVSTRVGGASTAVLHEETGFLADSDEGLAAAVRRVLEDPPLARRLGAQGTVHARETFSIDRLVDDVDALYRRLLAQTV